MKRIIIIGFGVILLFLLNSKFFANDGKSISREEYFQKQKEISERIQVLQRQLSKEKIDPEFGKTRVEIQAELDDLRSQILELNIQLTQPDTTSPNWKDLGSDIGLMVFKDKYGRVRGTLYVKYGKYWQSIAIDSVEEIGPYVVPGVE